MMPRILCVDDELNLLAALRRVLRDRFAVTLATDAGQALRILENEASFDAIVSDLSMPGVDGIALLDEVRMRWPHTARILLSGHGDGAEMPKRAGADVAHRRLGKPFPPMELASLIETTIDDLRYREAAEQAT